MSWEPLHQATLAVSHPDGAPASIVAAVSPPAALSTAFDELPTVPSVVPAQLSEGP